MKEIKIPVVLEHFKDRDLDFSYYLIYLGNKNKFYKVLYYEKITTINERTFRRYYYYMLKHFSENFKDVEDFLETVGINSSEFTTIWNENKEKLSSLLVKKTSDVKYNIEEVLNEGLFKLIYKITGIKFEVNKNSIKEIKNDKELKKTKFRNIDIEKKVREQIEINIKNNLKFGKKTIGPKIMEQSNFFKKLHELYKTKKHLEKQLERTQFKNKYATKNIENLVKELENFENNIEIDKKSMLFNSKTEHIEFYLKSKSDFKTLLKKVKNEIENLNIISEKRKEKILSTIQEFKEALNNIEQNWNISIIKTTLNNDKNITKYPLLNNIKEWIIYKMKEYPQLLFNEKILEKVEYNINNYLGI